MSRSYIPELKEKIICLYPEEERTYQSITAEYGVSKATVSKWCKEFREECQQEAEKNPKKINEAEFMKENLRLRKEWGGRSEGKSLLKKSGGIPCEGNRSEGTMVH